MLVIERQEIDEFTDGTQGMDEAENEVEKDKTKN